MGLLYGQSPAKSRAQDDTDRHTPDRRQWRRGLGRDVRGSPTAAIIERQRDTIIGWNPYDLEKLRKTFRMTPFFYGYVGYAALAAIEMACFDLTGKQTGNALSALIGGSMRDTVEVTGVTTARLLPPGAAITPDAIAGATSEIS